jgi:myosin heavy subunit
VEEFNYLNQSGCVKVEQIDDKAKFADLDAAILKCIPGGGAEKKGTLLQILAVLLHLGNVNFNNDSTPEDEAASVADPGALATEAEMLGMKADEIRAALAERVPAPPSCTNNPSCTNPSCTSPS